MIDYAEKILNSPDLPQVVKRLNQVLEDESRRRHEFREWVTPTIKAEFINGEVVLHSPVRRRHWNVTDLLSSLLSFFVRIKKLGVVGTEKVMVALTRNDYEPDLVFFSKEKADQFSEDQLLFPAPDFVVEILSKKTAATDRGVKKQDYAAHGVLEYWIVDPLHEQIEQYYLALPTDTTYLPARIFGPDDDIESRAVPGFVIPVRAVFDSEANILAMQGLMR
jgi:Uma2 family endonuclease